MARGSLLSSRLADTGCGKTFIRQCRANRPGRLPCLRPIGRLYCLRPASGAFCLGGREGADMMRRERAGSGMSETMERGVCLVIGAGDGLGAAVARAFAREGLAVCVTRRPRHAEAVEKLAEVDPRRGRPAPTPSGSTRASKRTSPPWSSGSSARSARSRFWSSTSAPTCGFRSSKRRRRSIPRSGKWPAWRDF